MKVAEYSKQSSKMFQPYRNKFNRFIQLLNAVNLIAHMESLISSHVKISNLNLSSCVKISCFNSKINPSNSHMFIQ